MNLKLSHLTFNIWASCVLMLAASALIADTTSLEKDVLLFRMSADTSLTADYANGIAAPNFLSNIHIVPSGKLHGAAQWDDDGIVTWRAPGNIYAQRGTVAFFWRSRTPVGEAPFNIFRVSFADHTSWDMTFLRIDWNGHGFDAFVTDTNLARVRVSFQLGTLPTPDQWQHLAFTWDESIGVRLFVDSKEVARKLEKADLDSGLDQFGFAGRIVSPHQVQSRYHFMRGSDFDELQIYDHALSASQVDSLSQENINTTLTSAERGSYFANWLHRYGWDASPPLALTSPSTIIRKIEFSSALDIKEEMRKGIDGIAETTWPGVYNRSTLTGRDDYFELPDWNVYVRGGINYDLTVPANESFNRVEIRGAAYGKLSYAANDVDAKKDRFTQLDTRKQGVLRSITNIAEHTGGFLRFSNSIQETPIQEIWAYNIHPGTEPIGTFKLSYKVKASAAPDFPCLKELIDYVNGRYPPEERATVVALPTSVKIAPASGSATDSSEAKRADNMAPLVHILIPSSFDDALPARPLSRAWNYGWQNAHDGLDGIALDIPALHLPVNSQGVIPLNIRVKDPIWPGRDMMDVTIAVNPDQPRTIWLDLRDRILTDRSFYIAVASAIPQFNADALDGMTIRMVFKDREQAKFEHIADRFNQVKDNWGFLVEEHTATKREALYQRVYADISDLLAVDPDNTLGRIYWQDISYYNQSMPPYSLPTLPNDVPRWASLQLAELKLVHQFTDWWIDQRQDEFGDFGGGISDDTDLCQQWPGLALMGVDPDKINRSLRALSDAVYKNGMIVNGLSYITTDELHVYEEGLNSDAERLYLNWGEPKTVERIMATVNALQKVIRVNPAGHMHFASNWYGGRKIYEEGPWQWQKPYSFTVLHSPILLGLYNANPAARHIVTGTIEGLLAHAKKDAKGFWRVPNEINWQSDTERAGDGGGTSTPLQAAWAAFRFTQNSDYLRLLNGVVNTRELDAVSDVGENVLDVLNKRTEWGSSFLKSAKEKPTAINQYVSWQISGDPKWLESIHEKQIRDLSQRMYMYTEGHRWTDRVEFSTEILQRERLGGVALQRNMTYPGNTVSWRFAEPGAAEKVAILVDRATPDHFKIIAFNTSDQVQRATMTTWDVVSGKWRMQHGTANDVNHISSIELGRSESIDLSFEPHTTSAFEFTLEQSSANQPDTRADLGIGIDDVNMTHSGIEVTVHSLGAVATKHATITLRDKSNHVISSASIGALDAPTDLKPKVTHITLRRPGNLALDDAYILVTQDDVAPEVTMMNNRVSLSAALQEQHASSR